MKKIQFYILMSFVFVLASSCQKQKGVEFTDLGSEFFISSSGYTSLDNTTTISIDNQQKNLSTIAVTNLGGTTANDSTITSTYTGSIALTGGKGSIALSDADLGMDTIGSSVKLQFDANFGGKPFSRFYTLTVKDPISVDFPAVDHRLDTTYYFHFDIAPKTATVETVKVQTKVSELGTYADVSGSFNAADSIPIKGSDYNVGDTLFVNVIGTVGTKTASTETAVVIKPNSFSHQSSFELSTANQAYDFVGDSVVPTGNESADIERTGSYTPTGLLVGFASMQNAEFVLATDADFANADKVAIAATDFSSAVKSVDNVAGGEVYIFRTKRGTGSYFYGIMKITKVDKPQGVLADSYIDIEYKY